MTYSGWDKNAALRHQQLTSGIDLSYSSVLIPQMLSVLQTSMGKRQLALEIGCGTGILAHELAGLFEKVVAVDPSIESIKIASKFTARKNSLFVCSTGEDFRLPNSVQADLAISNMAMHVIKNAEKAFRAIWLNLKPGGFFLFSIPHPYFFPEYRQEILRFGYEYLVEKEYEIPFVITADPNPLPALVSYFHRPLSVYTKWIGRAGFGINQILEPLPDVELKLKHPEYSASFTNPRFMIFNLEKRAI